MLIPSGDLLVYPRSSSSQRPRTRWFPFAPAAAPLSTLFVFALAPDVGADPPVGYYDTVDTTNPASLASTLHDVIDDHIRFPYTSTATDTWDILELAQQDPGDVGRILDVYRNESYAKQGAGNPLYEREHTWPRSFGFPNDSSSNSAFSDAHMLHLADASYNGSRSNKPFGPCDALCTLKETIANDGQGGGADPYPGDDNWTQGPGGIGGLLGRWEVWSGRRGDVARSLLYADVRYEGGLHGATGVSEPDLILTDDEGLIDASNTANNEATAYMGSLSTLLEWHAQDPVDDFERDRNDVVHSFQDNRNPFVDHPEWVASLFEAGPCVSDADCDDGVFCNGDETCDSGNCFAAPPPCTAPLLCDEAGQVCTSPPPAGAVWINEIHYDNSSTDVGEFFEIAGPAGTDLSGWSLVGYNGANGAVYASVALSGVIPLQEGCTGALSFDLAGIQNGSPDGFALIDPLGDLFEFISYEGTFAALTGTAAGETSVDVGVSESGSTPVGHSLQQVGTGITSADFVWQPPAPSSPGGPNTGQQFDACAASAVPAVPSRLGFVTLVGLLVALALRATSAPARA